MMGGFLLEQVDILRRIAERGMSEAYKLNDQTGNSADNFIDIFQHLLNEIDILKKVI